MSVVGERSKCVEVRSEGLVERLEVRMPISKAINQGKVNDTGELSNLIKSFLIAFL